MSCVARGPDTEGLGPFNPEDVREDERATQP